MLKYEGPTPNSYRDITVWRFWLKKAKIWILWLLKVAFFLYIYIYFFCKPLIREDCCVKWKNEWWNEMNEIVHISPRRDFCAHNDKGVSVIQQYANIRRNSDTLISFVQKDSSYEGGIWKMRVFRDMNGKLIFISQYAHIYFLTFWRYKY